MVTMTESVSVYVSGFGGCIGFILLAIVNMAPNLNIELGSQLPLLTLLGTLLLGISWFLAYRKLLLVEFEVRKKK